MLKGILSLVLFLLLIGCSFPTKYERDPANIGYGRDDLKKSRCACRVFYERGEEL